MNALLHAYNVSVIFQDRRILNHISLDIMPRGFVTIVGPNGAGKSMLLKVLMGFFPPTQGQVVRKPGLRIGYVPQRMHPPMTLPMTVERFLMLHRKADADSLRRTVLETNIESLLGYSIHVLSSGEMQRVLLARALLSNPELLILDEPAQNMDVGGQLAFYKLLEKIYQERACSILMVSHDLHLVMACSKQVICLYHHICCLGAPDMVAKDPAFISLFGNDMARMMAVYHHTHTHTHHQGEEEAHG